MWKVKKFRHQEFFPLMKFLVEMYEPDSYLEIGVQKGYTLLQMASLVPAVTGVDPAPLVKGKLPENVTIFKGLSKEYYESVAGEGKQFDLILIDGDHESHAVLYDIGNCVKLLKPYTGLLLLHDTYPGSPELATPGYCHDAWAAARTIHKLRKYNRMLEIVTLPGPYAGMSIVRYVPDGKHLHWEERNG